MPSADERQTRQRKRLSPVESCVEVISCHTRIDVIWQVDAEGGDAQDGTVDPHQPLLKAAARSAHHHPTREAEVAVLYTREDRRCDQSSRPS